MKAIQSVIDFINMLLIRMQTFVFFRPVSVVGGLLAILCFVTVEPAFAQQTPTVQQVSNNGISTINLIMKVISGLFGLAGLTSAGTGIHFAIKKSKPEFATQISALQIGGTFIGGIAMIILCPMIWMFANSLFGVNSQGATIQVGQ